MPFIFEKTPIEGLTVIKPRVFPDGRGFFVETYKESDFISAGITEKFVQDNHSSSVKGVLRGLHYQKNPFAQGKLVRVTRGCVWDVAVDLREKSATFGKWFGIKLDDVDRTMFYLPPGFAHGFVTLSDTAEFQYKCTAEYNKESEGGIIWNDSDLKIEWPCDDVMVSDKDKILPSLSSSRGLF